MDFGSFFTAAAFLMAFWLWPSKTSNAMIAPLAKLIEWAFVQVTFRGIPHPEGRLRRQPCRAASWQMTIGFTWFTSWPSRAFMSDDACRSFSVPYDVKGEGKVSYSGLATLPIPGTHFDCQQSLLRNA